MSDSFSAIADDIAEARANDERMLGVLQSHGLTDMHESALVVEHYVESWGRKQPEVIVGTAGRLVFHSRSTRAHEVVALLKGLGMSVRKVTVESA